MLGVVGEHALYNLADRQGAVTIVIDTLGLHTLDGDAGGFGAYNLFRRQDTVAQHFADTGARNIETIFGVVRAGLRGGMAGAARAVEHFVEQAYVDAEFFRFEFVEDGVAGVFIVEASDTGVVAP